MGIGANDTQMKELLEYTKALLSAAQSEECDEIGRLLVKRGRCLDAIKAAGGFGSPRTAERQSIIDEILLFDGKACGEIRELKSKSGLAMTDYQKKSAGLLKYSSAGYNLVSGQLIDKKD